MNNNRRMFLKGGGIAIASFGLLGGAPSFMQRAVMGQGLTKAGRRKTLIAIFQRGAVDGLNMIVPHGDADYYKLRPTIAIAKPVSRASGVINPNNTDAALDLDGFFGLHPSLAPLQPYFAQKRMAIVHAAGSPDATRSHFDAQDYMESGTPGIKSTRDGWLNRIMQTDKEGHTLFRAVAMSNTLPRSLQGRAEALAISDLRDFTIRAGANSARVQGGFESLYEETAGDVLTGTGRDTFEAVKYLKRVNPSQYRAQNGARYPNGKFGASLLQIAQLIKSDVGLEVAFAETGGWDTHVNQGGARGQLAIRLGEFAQGIAALTADLGDRMDDVVILTMSEFGRTARENGTRGTDHGHANAMLVIGNNVRGGKVYGDWLGLSDAKMHEGRDLALTTDFRNVFGEIANKHLGVRDMRSVFPDFEIQAKNFRGVLG